MGGVEFKRNSVVIGENVGKIYAVIRYPTKVDIGWSSKPCNIPSTIVVQSFTPGDNTALMEAVSRNIIQNRGVAESTRDPLTRQRAEKGVYDGEKLIMQIDQNGETVGLMSTIIMATSKDESVFAKVCRKVEGVFAAIRCKIRGMANLQKDAFRAIAPYYGTDEYIDNITQYLVPLSTFVGGFPFSASGLNDGTGYYFAKDSNGGLIILDPWKRGGDRTNSNWVIMGVAGVGKSTTTKHLIINEYAKGTKILIIDPESEYKELCRSLGGDWINCGGGVGGKINPLQVRPMPEDDEIEDADEKPEFKLNTAGMGALALHMKTLEIFFSLYIPSLTDIQKALLKEVLEIMYANFGITWDTDVTNLNNKQFPIFSDLYDLLLKKSAEKEQSRRDNEVNNYEILSCLIRDIAVGADSFIWNGHTDVEPHSRIICLDTSQLQNTSDQVKRAQYFNVLSWCWGEMSRDRTERVLLIGDEAYLMIDPNVPQALVFARNVEKRARKYEAAIAFIFHSAVDVLDPSIKMYGQALLDIPNFKILMGTDGVNHKELTALYNLTEAEQDVLAAKKRVAAIFAVGSKRMYVNFEIPEYEKEVMGTRGGR